jgi:hypothetical protein
VYVVDSAPGTIEQVSMLVDEVQRSHSRPALVPGGPVHLPPLAVSVLVTCAVPETVGAS